MISAGKSFQAIILAVTVAVLFAFTGSASATALTSPSGTIYTGAFKAEGAFSWSNYSLKTSITCQSAMLEGEVKQHGTSVTVVGALSKATFSNCGGDHITALKPGSLEIHASGGGNGLVTSSGLEFKVEHTTFGIHCIYTTNNTWFGTLTGSGTTNATLGLEFKTLARTGGSPFCGSSAAWGGSYKFVTPSTLLVD